MKPTAFNFRLQYTALWLAWIGGAIGTGASFYSWKAMGEFATTTFVASMIAWLATIPVARQRRAMQRSGAEEHS